MCPLAKPVDAIDTIFISKSNFNWHYHGIPIKIMHSTGRLRQELVLQRLNSRHISKSFFKLNLHVQFMSITTLCFGYTHPCLFRVCQGLWSNYLGMLGQFVVRFFCKQNHHHSNKVVFKVTLFKGVTHTKMCRCKLMVKFDVATSHFEINFSSRRVKTFDLFSLWAIKFVSSSTKST